MNPTHDELYLTGPGVEGQEAVSLPYSPPTSYRPPHERPAFRSASRDAPPARPTPAMQLSCDFFEHPVLREAGVLASWMWLAAKATVTRRATNTFLTAAEVKGLVE